MSRFGTLASGASAIVEFIESADPLDMQTRVLVAEAAILAASPSRVIYAQTLAGAGDGHTFVVQLAHAAATDVDGGLVPAGSLFYLASDSEALAVARAVWIPAFANVSIADEQLAGASKGTRFMGMIVAGVVIPPGPT